MKTIINFSEFDKIQLGNLNNKTVLVLNKQGSSHYLAIPTGLQYNLSSQSIEVFPASDNELSLYQSFDNLFKQLKSTIVLSKKKILLKGLGFRSTFEDSTRTLTFKLGYSHMNKLDVPNYIKNIKIKKKHNFS